MERIDGRATPAGTTRHAARAQAAGLPAAAFRPLGGSGLLVSRLGFGAYRVAAGVPEHAAALAAALRGGVNVVDTSTNYAGGGSERLVGEVLGGLIAAGAVARDEVVVVSKAGYVQGPALEDVQRRAAEGAPVPDVVRYAEDCWHCVHPTFLREQLERTLARTRLACVDVYLLHNPEYFLMDAVQRGRAADVPALRRELEDRVRRAFILFEEERGAGRIGAYGVSSNTLPRPAADPTAVPLPLLLRAAAAAAEAVHGGGHAPGLHVVQLPYNLVEDEAARTPTTAPQGASTLVPVLEAARQAGLGVLVNRPLNAIRGERLLRLAGRPPAPSRDREPQAARDPDEAVQRAALRFATSERALLELVARHAPGVRPAPAGPWLLQNGAALTTSERLAAAVERILLPRSADLVRQARAALPTASGPADRDELEEAVRRLNAALRAWAGVADERAAERAARELLPFVRDLDAGLPSALRDEPLARKALWYTAETPGVTCVLNGMRRVAYVEDALAVLRHA